MREWVTAEAEPLVFTSLHLSECVSALRLKCFRGECAKLLGVTESFTTDARQEKLAKKAGMRVRSVNR
jgi:hypothetical protein